MTDLNNLNLIGRVVHDIGDRNFGYVGNGTARLTVSIAVNRSRKDGDKWIDEVSYFDVNVWGKQAENLKPYLTKGTHIAVEGFLKQERWEKDGQKFSKVSITANTIHLLGKGKKADDGNTAIEPAPAYAPSEAGDFAEDVPF